jgi:hypothetical protein
MNIHFDEYKYPGSGHSISKNEVTSDTTQDGYDSTMKAALLVYLDQCVKCVFRHYRRN